MSSWKDRVWKSKDEGTNEDLNNIEAGVGEAKALAEAAAPLTSPEFAGNPTALTQPEHNNSTRLATTAYADNASAVARAAAESASDKKGEATTEKERALAAEALKANIASPTLSGTPKAPTQAKGDNSTAISTTAYTDRAAGEATRGPEGPAGPAGTGFDPKFTNLGKVTGNVTISMASFNIFEAEPEAAVKIEKPTGWPGGYTEALLLIKQPAEAKKITVGAGVTIVGGPFNEEPNALNVFSMISPDGGTTVYLLNAAVGPEGSIGPTGPKGTTGEKGTTGSEGPPGALGKTKALGVLAAGKHKVNVGTYQAFTAEVTGNVEIELEGWPPGDCEPVFFLTNDVSGGHKISFPGVAWEPSEPEFNEAAGGINIVPLASPDEGVHVYGIRAPGIVGPEGPKGEKGTTGEKGEAGAPVGAWTSLTLAANMETGEGTEYLKPEIRTENNGAVARLRGRIKAKTGKEIVAGGEVMTVPVGFRPSKKVVIPMATGSSVPNLPSWNTGILSTAGVLTIVEKLASEKHMNLDGITWSIT